MNKFCLKCLMPFPPSEYEVGKRTYTMCRTCRRKHSAKMAMRKKRVRAALQAKIEPLITAEQHQRREAALKAVLKPFRIRYNQLTGVIRTRIRLMEQIEQPADKTTKALAIRRQQLAAYNEAYEEQVAMLKAGFQPPALVDMICAL